MLPTVTERVSEILDRWHYPAGPYRAIALSLVAISIATVSLLVYRQGGGASVYSHLMYAPVLLAAFCFQVPGGLVTGVVAGVALGPLAGLQGAGGMDMDAASWLMRTGFFMSVGVLAGIGFRIVSAQLSWVRHHAYHDPSTGLPNLMALRSHIHGLAHRHEADQGSELVVLAFNLVNLADIVNTLGYRKTEVLIERLAGRIRDTLTEASMVARVDSDKFAAVLVSDGADWAPTQAMRDLRDTDMNVERVPIHVESSVGIARGAFAGEESDVLISMAEIAARRAYAERAGIAVYDAGQDSRSSDNLRLLGELRRAIEEDQLELYYQPKLRLASGQVIGVEALLRWRHPERGIILPGQFIPQAEHTALIRPLTRWVVRAALNQLADWQESGIELEVALNLSANNLSERDLLGRIAELIEHHGIRPEMLTLEITESALMYPTADMVDALSRLRDKGVKVAIDDFGAGYSCLAYLKTLPVTSLKIDRSFITGMRDDRDRIIVQTAIDFGHHLDLEVVAEGVETPEVLGFLRSMSCDQAQGYHIGHPVPAAELRRLVAEGFGTGAPVPA